MRAAYPLEGAARQPAKLDDLVMYSNGVTMPRDYTTIADRVYNFHCRPDDVWVVTYPKVRRRRNETRRGRFYSQARPGCWRWPGW